MSESWCGQMHIELVNPREITDVSADMLDLDDLTFVRMPPCAFNCSHFLFR